VIPGCGRPGRNRAAGSSSAQAPRSARLSASVTVETTFVKDATVAILALVVSVVMIAGAGQLSVFAGFLVILLGWIILLAMFIMKGRYGVTSFDQVGVPIDQDPKAMAAYVASQESTD
jgi:hypothetical protein